MGEQTNEKAQCTHWLIGAKVGIPQMYDLRCTREPHYDGKHLCGSTDWNDSAGEYRPEPTPPSADDTFIGSAALLTALYETYEQHIGITETDGPDGGYIWCACGWRSDDLGPNSAPGASYAVHLTNAQHAAAVKALQPIVVRRSPGQGRLVMAADPYYVAAWDDPVGRLRAAEADAAHWKARALTAEAEVARMADEMAPGVSA